MEILKQFMCQKNEQGNADRKKYFFVLKKARIPL